MSLTAATHKQAEPGLALHNEFGLFLLFIFQNSSLCLRLYLFPDAFYMQCKFLLRSSHSECLLLNETSVTAISFYTLNVNFSLG